MSTNKEAGMDIKIGMLFWAFDGNRRMYDENRRLIYEHCFYRVEVIGETSRSWIVGREGSRHEAFKAPKKDTFGKRLKIYTDEMKANDVWLDKHRYKIIDIFNHRNNVTASQMKKIAEIVGYEINQQGEKS